MSEVKLVQLFGRIPDSEQVKEMRADLDQLKLLVAELSLKNRRSKKTLNGLGEQPWQD